MSQYVDRSQPEDFPFWWSNKPKAMPPLSLEALKREYQRLTICGLCGLNLELKSGSVKMIGGTPVHARCPL